MYWPLSYVGQTSRKYYTRYEEHVAEIRNSSGVREYSKDIMSTGLTHCILTHKSNKNGVFWDVAPCGSCKNRHFKELSASFIRVTRISEIGITLAVWRMMSAGMLRRAALVRAGVSEEPGASFIRVTRIGELGTTQADNSNRRTLRRNTRLYFVCSYKNHSA
jgi:hypothetical protein